jgi:hypothetical protein
MTCKSNIKIVGGEKVLRLLTLFCDYDCKSEHRLPLVSLVDVAN